MPVFENHEEIQARFKVCNEKLKGLFAGLTPTQEFIDKLNKIHDYYLISHERAIDMESAICIIDSYEMYVNNLQSVKSGEMSADEALETIQEAKDSRDVGIFMHNVAKVCEVLFWAAVVVTCYLTLFSVALPLLLTQPPAGLVTGLGILGLFFYGADELANCFGEFKSPARLKDEFKREVDVVSFFKPQERQQVESPQNITLATSVS